MKDNIKPDPMGHELPPADQTTENIVRTLLYVTVFAALAAMFIVFYNQIF